MSFSEKVYRFMLRAYPRDYRGRYGEPMEQLFRDRVREATAFKDLVTLWGQILADWALSVPARHWERTTHWRFTPLADPARRCIFFARSEASSFSRREITIEHLLLGVLREDPSLVQRVSLETVVRVIEATESAGRRVPPMEDLHLSEAAIRVVEAAKRIAESTGRRTVAPADLAGGILREANTLAARLLREHSSDCD